jgi:hypothetical protein
MEHQQVSPVEVAKKNLVQKLSENKVKNSSIINNTIGYLVS